MDEEIGKKPATSAKRYHDFSSEQLYKAPFWTGVVFTSNCFNYLIFFLGNPVMVHFLHSFEVNFRPVFCCNFILYITCFEWKCTNFPGQKSL